MLVAFPSPERIGLGPSCLAAEQNADRFTRLRLAEDSHRHIALQQHVIADDAWELDIGERLAG